MAWAPRSNVVRILFGGGKGLPAQDPSMALSNSGQAHIARLHRATTFAVKRLRFSDIRKLLIAFISAAIVTEAPRRGRRIARVQRPHRQSIARPTTHPKA